MPFRKHFARHVNNRHDGTFERYALFSVCGVCGDLRGEFKRKNMDLNMFIDSSARLDGAAMFKNNTVQDGG